MGPRYAGVLGPLAMSVWLIRGQIRGSVTDTHLLVGAMILVIFSSMGYIIGHLAQRSVEESVRDRLSSELAPGHSAQPRQVKDHQVPGQPALSAPAK